MRNEILGWMVVDQLGHKRLAGYVTEQTVAGRGFLRIEVPEGEKPLAEQVKATTIIHPDTIYSMTPVTESLARAVARGIDPAPVHEYDLPRPKDLQLQSPSRSRYDYDEDEEQFHDR